MAPTCPELVEGWAVRCVASQKAGQTPVKPLIIEACDKGEARGCVYCNNKPCFEFWLLLHLLEKSDERLGAITNANSASNLLKQLLGAYSKRNVDMSYFPISSLPKAIRTGREVDGGVTGGDIPHSNTGRTYLLWEEVIRNASINQLPPELVELKNGRFYTLHETCLWALFPLSRS